MKIAIPLDYNKRISDHFGHSQYFLVAEFVDNQVKNKNIFDAPDHQFGSYPMWLISQNIDVLICKGIGHKAVEILNNKGVKVITGVESADPDEALDKFVKGEVTSTGAFCEGGSSCH
ncbi:iron-molybdenum cofactor-binding protein [Deferribacter desulfuricans SSM1]|uniref:Iron-molybdenum cofactor-binding protein n=1 Tax=Deferribacter desulfuricans (strain DSM 14783 / JCM 11476 / NBRC 101012 / SSM1) TaxID=639282 RepID=D3P8V1_DEFDS|nr:NifB/NifX family molybdenum-iron cluster-binding protein [Deferribacter desulfuricans]BAI81141.1 iron-molybdenum cofactor-binding protein [Deferribacter desulfuricans SSM1]